MAAQNNTGYEAYYVPDNSRLAICMAVSLALTVFGLGSVFNGHTFHGGEVGASWFIVLLGVSGFIATLFSWFRTTIIEHRAGMNSAQLQRSYVMGMQWFIFSEVMFFASFFGALFYVRHWAAPWLGGEGDKGLANMLWEGFQYNWPMETTPQEAVGLGNQTVANNGTFVGVKEPISPWHLPLLNTILLLSSSFTVHIAHHALKDNNRGRFNLFLAITLILGFSFVGVQAFEYYEAYTHLGLTLKAGIYGSTFFMLTGFHGFHVCMGAIMLSVQWLRSTTRGHFTAEDHFGFEASSWYWHFVDVVWVGLFLFVYIL